VIILGLVIVGNVAGPLLPDSGGELAFGVVSAVIAGLAGAGLWRLRQWGFIATVVVAALNLLQDVPATVIASTAAIKVVAGLSALACALVIVLATRPEARRAYR
jgi:uncharacterized membrane protein (DUF2068 family)